MRGWLAEQIGVSEGVAGVLLTVTVVVVVLVVRWLVVRTVTSRIEDSTLVFRARKTATYVAAIVILATVGWIYFEAFGNVATFLGLVSVGLAIALADLLLNFAGWGYILLRHPFRIGDRIEIDGKAGDVIDIRVLRFSLLEIRGWVKADQPTGRIVHVPNGELFRKPMANFTEGFRHIFHEVEIPLTYESDWRRARELILDILSDHTMTEEEMEAAQEFREASRHYFLRSTELEPNVFVARVDEGVLLTGRLVCRARERREIDSLVWSRVFEAFEREPAIRFAYPTVRSYLPDAIAVTMPDGESPGPGAGSSAVTDGDGRSRH